MKTCKTGCGKMKAGGSVKKLAKGGQALNKAKGFAKAQTGGDNVSKNIFGVPNAGTTGPNRTATYDYKKGGAIKKYAKGGASKGCPPGYYWTVDGCEKKGPGYKKPLSSISSRIGVGTVLAGAIGTGIKAISDRVKENKAKKKEAEEKKKKEAETPKAKFGASVPVKASCKQGMVRSADGKCVMSRPKFKSGGSSFGMLSVKAGVDKNPNPTAADRIAGAKMNKKKIGGSIKKLAKAQKGYISGASGDAPLGSHPFRTSGSKLAVGSIVAGGLASGIKTISDKVKAKKAADEKKKNESASKAKLDGAKRK